MTGEFVLVTAPTVEPLTTAEAKAHLNVSFSDDDTLIDRMVAAARRRAESHLDRSLVNTTWDYRFDDFPEVGPNAHYGDRAEWLRAVTIPKASLVSVTSVTYYSTDNVSTVLSASEYVVQAGTPGLIYPAPGYDWPSVTSDRVGAVVVRCVVGYGATAASVPEDVKTGLLLLVGHLYNHRDSVEDTGFPMPMAARYFLDSASWGSRP